MSERLIKFIIVFFFLGLLAANAEDKTGKDSTDIIKKENNDTSSFQKINSIISKQRPAKKGFQMRKSPTGAVIRSLIIPGWGQFYVENYWKTPVFLGAAGALTYFIMDNHNSYSTRQGQYDALFSMGEGRTSAQTSKMDFLKRQKEAYRDLRDQYALYLFGVYVIGAVDAYAGAHLFDFNVDDDLALFIFPDPFTGTFTLNLSIGF